MWGDPVTVATSTVSTQVLTVGLTYRDLVFTGVPALPASGEEVHANAFHETWGGICNMARVCRTLGMDTALATAVGEDRASDDLLSDMAAMGIDTSLTRRHPRWELPVTAALSLPGDRAMVTVEEPPPSGVSEHLATAKFHADAIIVDMRDRGTGWLKSARSRGATVYASRGCDPTGVWSREALAEADSCDMWMLNEMEACAFTGQDDARAAARALSIHVPLVVVTRGALGMIGVDGTTGEEAKVEAFPVTPRGTTGAGDSTLASFVFANSIPDLSLERRLDVAAFIATAILGRPRGAADPPRMVELLETSVGKANVRLGSVHEALQRVADQ